MVENWQFAPKVEIQVQDCSYLREFCLIGMLVAGLVIYENFFNWYACK